MKKKNIHQHIPAKAPNVESMLPNTATKGYLARAIDIYIYIY